MKIPKKIRRYCKYCHRHTEHSVSIAKKRDRGSLKKGSLQRLEKRGSGKSGFGNKGKFSRGPISKWKRSGAKGSKKTDLRFKCAVCSKTSVQRAGIRSKKVLIE